jgi:hypothetical protein
LAGQAALTKEIPLLMESDHGFLALLGNHGDLALAQGADGDRVKMILRKPYKWP